LEEAEELERDNRKTL